MPGKKTSSPKQEELTAKFIKAFSGPKKDPPMLIDLTWFKTKEPFFVTKDEIKGFFADNAFYEVVVSANTYQKVYFCSQNTYNNWSNYANGGKYYEWNILQDERFSALYKILSMEYYDP